MDIAAAEFTDSYNGDDLPCGRSTAPCGIEPRSLINTIITDMMSKIFILFIVISMVLAVFFILFIFSKYK